MPQNAATAASPMVKSAAERALDWLFDCAFPLWAEKGVDPRGGFVEALSLKGERLPLKETRVRVQARQTFTFALAHGLGWEPETSAELVRRGVEFLWKEARLSNGLYGRKLVPGAGMTDATPDLYDMAFCLLAYATAYRETGDELALEAGNELNRLIDTKMKRPEPRSGYFETVPAPVIRAQNPHMHLLEASLAWYEALGDSIALDRVTDLVGFAQSRFLWPDPVCICELYHPATKEVDGNRVEVGHQFEWSWLLGEYARALSISRLDVSAQLYETAQSLTEEDGRILLSHEFSGRVREPVFRTWGQTEALKAHIMRAKLGADGAEASIRNSVDRLFTDHLEGNVVEGGWRDRLSIDGKLLSTDMPASTGYHVVLAFHELIRYCEVR